MVNNQVNNDEAAAYALDVQNAERLWALCENLVGQKFSHWHCDCTIIQNSSSMACFLNH